MFNYSTNRHFLTSDDTENKIPSMHLPTPCCELVHARQSIHPACLSMFICEVLCVHLLGGFSSLVPRLSGGDLIIRGC